MDAWPHEFLMWYHHFNKLSKYVYSFFKQERFIKEKDLISLEYNWLK